MTIQSFFDVRAFLAKFVHILQTPHAMLGVEPATPNAQYEVEVLLSLPQAYTNGFIQKMLMFFYNATSELMIPNRERHSQYS